MSGPVDPADGATTGGAPADQSPIEVTDSKDRQVGRARVRRALPQRTRRTVGAWCFADHLGPLSLAGGRDRGTDSDSGTDSDTGTDSAGLDIGPHPHTGLATVTWLLQGELLHRDSLGTEQPITRGQLNLMHAGHGVSHAEEQLSREGVMHGAQLWVAQPESTRHGDAGFEHHTDLPRHEVPGGVATVLLGSLGEAFSPARTDTPLLGAELELQRAATSTWGLTAAYEHAIVVLAGAVVVDDRLVTPGRLGHLGLGREELVLTAVDDGTPTRLLLLGGEPFEAPLTMWWNYVGRSHGEMRAAHAQWTTDDGRFGTVDSRLPRMASPAPV